MAGARSPSLVPAIPDVNDLARLESKWQKALETEAQLVVDDARTALRSLAANFLPADLSQFPMPNVQGSK